MSKEDKRYYIDPGIGEKRYTCPYSCFEDGRDAKQDIIPPKGYVLKGFKFEAHSPDKYYDGKLIAQYERAPFMTILKQNRWLIRLALLLVIGLVAFLAFSIFSKPKTAKVMSPGPLVVADTLPADTIPKTDALAVNSNPSETETKLASTQDSIDTSSMKETKGSLSETTSNNSTEAEKEDMKTEPEVPAEGPDAQFRQAFWKMIHNRNGQMDAYTKLYNDYKGKVKGKEYSYLLGTILKNTTSFKAWKNKLHKIPTESLASINTIDELTKKLNE